ncbi:2-phospho-L-lactate guanylyltransferase [Haloferax namakaokahaiae]|uniref:2-phospho-L-lactate guanylyltransferase n=1 Tax=Haloferax namakaokahaiae TaxID=1748331 RepID=A0ABD5ZCH5_9EURY
MRVVVPFGVRSPKTRLDSLFSLEERRELAVAMLRDVLDALCGHDPVVVADAPFEASLDVPVELDDRPLTEAVAARLGGDEPIAVVMSDLALATPESISRLFETRGDIVAAPGLGGGTNALVVRHPEFTVDYHGASIRDHRRIARDIGATMTELDSMRLAIDIDEPRDLAEVLIHGEGHARAWLVEAGVELHDSGSRVTSRRNRR